MATPRPNNDRMSASSQAAGQELVVCQRIRQNPRGGPRIVASPGLREDLLSGPASKEGRTVAAARRRAVLPIRRQPTGVPKA